MVSFLTFISGLKENNLLATAATTPHEAQTFSRSNNSMTASITQINLRVKQSKRRSADIHGFQVMLNVC